VVLSVVSLGGLTCSFNIGVSSLPHGSLHVFMKAWSWHCWIDESMALDKCPKCFPKMVINKSTCPKQKGKTTLKVVLGTTSFLQLRVW
jgi:hypothetical protein